MRRIDKKWDDEKVKLKVDELLNNSDEGELFIEEVFSENILFDDNKVKNASYDQDKGFGLRTVEEDSINFSHSSELSEDALINACNSVKRKNYNSKKESELILQKSNLSLYTNENPINQISLREKISFLNTINKFSRDLDQKVKEVSVSLNANYQNIEVITKNGNLFYDSRPLVRLNINISVQKKGQLETGSFGMGGRYLYDKLLTEEKLEKWSKKGI